MSDFPLNIDGILKADSNFVRPLFITYEHEGVKFTKYYLNNHDKEIIPANDTIMKFIHAAERASVIQLYYFDKLPDYKLKDDKSFITLADTHANAELTDFLKKEFSDHIILGEESDGSKPALMENWDKAKKYIIFDPLDGTKNFANKNVFATTMCEMEYREGQGWVATNSLIFNPKDREVYIATEGQGAYISGGLSGNKKIKFDSSKESESLENKLVTLSTFGRELLTDIKNALSKELDNSGISKRSFGVTSLDLLNVANGTHGACLIGKALQPWDVEAACLFLKESGCVVERKKIDVFDVATSSWNELDMIIAGRDKGILKMLRTQAEIVVNDFNSQSVTSISGDFNPKYYYKKEQPDAKGVTYEYSVALGNPNHKII